MLISMLDSIAIKLRRRSSMHLMFIQVESEWERGNRFKSYETSRLAKNWGIAGIILFSVLLFLIFLAFGLIFGLHWHSYK